MDFKDINNKDDFIKFKSECISDLDDSINELMLRDYKQSVNLTYWIRDYKNFLKQEKTFDSTFLPAYKFGSIVEINLGFRVGSEFGGQHYGIVINRKDKKSNSNLTVIPMRSLKPNLHYSEINIGNEFYNLAKNKVNLLTEQHNAIKNDLEKEIGNLKEMLKNKDELNCEDSTIISEIDLDNKLKELLLKDRELSNKIKELSNCLKRISKLKDGSIALPNQVLTISKMRVKDPIRLHDTLYNITLSDSTMEKIKEKFEKIYF